MPDGWTFVIAPSGARAEKTGGARDRYNRLSSATACLLALWNAHKAFAAPSLGAALVARGNGAADELHALIDAETPDGWDPAALHRRLTHFVREDARVVDAAAAFAAADGAALGALSADSQEDAHRLLGNQVDETRALVASARGLGAIGACSFGAGFGGSVWAVVERDRARDFAHEWDSAAFAVRPSPPLTEFRVEAGTVSYNGQ
ncbi:MAG TPA: hypothetical protein VG871_06100 [Vicinamibacterales bacterium]|nr:hypothetical protein [Vicinamibacterales bacterium]